jgi:hypothetical protein
MESSGFNGLLQGASSVGGMATPFAVGVFR